MRGDGRVEFFRKLDVDKDMMKLLCSFRELKTSMLKDCKDSYFNGKIYKDENNIAG
jgi:hypothetical protein